MLWIGKASLANCTHLGASAAIASALSFGPTCVAIRRPVVQPIMQKPATARLASQPKTDLLPDIKPITMPVQPPVDCAVEACLALTFDDGPHAQTTPQLLDVLAANQVKATFFMLGSQALKYPEIVKRVHAEGHEIGSHSWIHTDYTKFTPQQMLIDYRQTEDVLKREGVESITLFRPPYGARNDTVRQTVPVSLALWNIDPEDWRETNPQVLAPKIVAQAKPGGVIVLHDIQPETVAAAPQFVAELKKHYKLVTMTELLGLKPDTPKGEFRGR